jgi:hypothetical protein
MTKDTSGTAFPVIIDLGQSVEYSKGMTLRDYFAAAALQGLLACPVQPQSGPDMYARDAYTLADAMLKAREA